MVSTPTTPATPAEQFAAALDAHRAGRLDEAQAIYRDILALDPAHTDALHYYGVARHQLGDHEGALALMDSALQLASDNAILWSNRGLAVRALGRTSYAIRCLREALRLEPGFADAHNNLGITLQETGADEEALDHYRMALTLDPAFVNARVNAGIALVKLGRPDEALAHYREALAQAPHDTDVHFNLGNAYLARGDYDAAIERLRVVVGQRPAHADAWANLGTALGRAGDYRGAEACYREAVALKPNAANLVSLGASLGAQGRNDEEAPYYRRALELDPEQADARQNLVWLMLKRGEYREGWAEYAKRWRACDYSSFDIEGLHEWRGEPLDGKRVLLIHEQGFGDQIQFVRYATMLHARGATVDVCSTPPVLRLAQSVRGVRRAWTGEPEGDYDFWVYMMSMPSCVGTELDTIPAEVPYLFARPADIEAWRPRVQAAMFDGLSRAAASVSRHATEAARRTSPTRAGTKPRKPAGHRNVGLVWAGNPGFYNDHNRSVALADLRPVLESERITWFSLQKGDAARAQIASLGGEIVIHDFSTDLHDFADTAALIMNLDLVIAVDTAVAHLAGALGKPVWILVPVNGEWRWLEKRADSPWYPTARLFRQHALGDWRGAIESLRDALGEKPKRTPKTADAKKTSRTKTKEENGAPDTAA
ncbi:tetratricopeptide repeat protein [Paraburkholderia dinghuensis]|uniref:Tetratricopeptide repeat protein n=1 Tax=Paraburkholderia dinghuensis TaxID=2305225 RepID=A0A3N6NYM9_9BURK|nr:tetratricopeptide repeat protein [Paraburkholderia dinghuensis]RQH05993.1 tetratricopeptide repeat protein [Paraburkholderia dinghuensis]